MKRRIIAYACPLVVAGMMVGDFRSSEAKDPPFGPPPPLFKNNSKPSLSNEAVITKSIFDFGTALIKSSNNTNGGKSNSGGGKKHE